jgi:hypothetical protein
VLQVCVIVALQLARLRDCCLARLRDRCVARLRYKFVSKCKKSKKLPKKHTQSGFFTQCIVGLKPIQMNLYQNNYKIIH